MRIACLVTVCAAISSTLHAAGTVHSVRQKHSWDRQVELSGRNASTPSEISYTGARPAASSSPQAIPSSSYKRESRKPRRVVQRTRRNRPTPFYQYNITPSKRGRSRRQLKRLKTRSLHLARSYDVSENQIETIQSPVVFEKGSIHIEPLYKVSKKKNILDSILEIVKKVIDPPAHLGPLVGPLHFPGLGEKVYIRLLEPVDSDNVVIRLITQMPVSDIESELNENIFPSTSILENMEVSAIEHHSPFTASEPIVSSSNQHRQLPSTVLSTEIMHPSGSHGQKLSKVTPGSVNQIEGRLSRTGPREIPYTSRVFQMNSKRAPIHIQTVNRPRLRYADGYPKLRDSRHYNGNWHETSYSKGNDAFATTKMKETTDLNENKQLQEAHKHEESAFYPYHPSYYKFGPSANSPLNGTEDEGTKKLEDTEAKESLNPLFVIGDSSSSHETVIRTSRVVQHDSPPASYPLSGEAFEVVKAPTMVTTRVPVLPKNRTTGADESYNGTMNRFNYVHLNGNYGASETSMPSARRNDSADSRLMRNGSSTISSGKVSITNNQSWEPIKVGDTVMNNLYSDHSARTPDRTQMKSVTEKPTIKPTAEPIVKSTMQPTMQPTMKSTTQHTIQPTMKSAAENIVKPTMKPTMQPALKPTMKSLAEPIVKPTMKPTMQPTGKSVTEPIMKPTMKPTVQPTVKPTMKPTVKPTMKPTVKPTVQPIMKTTVKPTAKPTVQPAMKPTMKPTTQPVIKSTMKLTMKPTMKLMMKPTTSLPKLIQTTQNSKSHDANRKNASTQRTPVLSKNKAILTKGNRTCSNCQNPKDNGTTLEEYDYEEPYFEDDYDEAPSGKSQKSTQLSTTTAKSTTNAATKLTSLHRSIEEIKKKMSERRIG